MQRDGARPGDMWSYVLPGAPAMPEPQGLVCVESGVLRAARDISLVLSSQNIEHEIIQSERGPWEIYVADARAPAAQAQIELYKQENPGWDEDAIALPLLRPSAQPVWLLLIPALCAALQSLDYGMKPAGMADAQRILGGEWWRLFTAQTLHADSHHLVSNLVSGFLVFSLISFKMPLSRIAPFIVLAAAFANLGTALLMRNYFSLGFSTTVFAGLGALATLEVRALGREGSLWRRFVPWLAAFMLAVFMGVGDEMSRTDIPGHFLGLAAGAAAGFAPPRKWLRWGEPLGRQDVAAALGVYAFFAAMWSMALS